MSRSSSQQQHLRALADKRKQRRKTRGAGRLLQTGADRFRRHKLFWWRAAVVAVFAALVVVAVLLPTPLNWAVLTVGIFVILGFGPGFLLYGPWWQAKQRKIKERKREAIYKIG